MVIRFSANPPFSVIFENVSLQGFPLRRPKTPELLPSSHEDFCFSWEPGSEFTARTIPQESFWHLFPGISANLSEGQGVQAGGRMRECMTANLAVVGFKLLPEW